jgi:hypothetical protein
MKDGWILRWRHRAGDGSRLSKKQGVANRRGSEVLDVAFPATPLFKGKCRECTPLRKPCLFDPF